MSGAATQPVSGAFRPLEDRDTLQIPHYHADAPCRLLPGFEPSVSVLRSVMDGKAPAQDELDGQWMALDEEGVLRHVAWTLLSAKHGLDPSLATRLRRELAQGEAEKLSDDQELALLFEAAAAQDIRMLVFKGEALARQVYPSAGCRPTGDFDLLIRPADIAPCQQLLSGLGYQPGRLAGRHLFAEQAWTCPPEVRGRHFLVDLHWDITNRRFFRNRIGFDELRDASAVIDLSGVPGRAPSLAHGLAIACTHLAAAPLAEPVLLRWLLDIHLLLDALSDEQFRQLLDTLAGPVRDAVLVYCEASRLVLGTNAHDELLAGALASVSRNDRERYAKTIDNRLYDLAEYGVRLRGVRELAGFFSEVLSFARVGKKARRSRPGLE